MDECVRVVYLEFVLKEIFLVGKFAVQAEEPLFVCGKGLRFFLISYRCYAWL